VVLESASIEVDRRARRAKTDRLDGGKLLKQLVRHHREREFLRVVRVPSVEHEDERRLHRELERLKRRKTAWLKMPVSALGWAELTVFVDRASFFIR